MPDFYHQKTNFTGGEWDGKLKARTDLNQFGNACEVVTNYIPRPLGGIIPRPGTDFVARVKDPTTNVILLPFEFSTSQAYMLEVNSWLCAINSRKAVCDHGHEFTEANTRWHGPEKRYRRCRRCHSLATNAARKKRLILEDVR